MLKSLKISFFAIFLTSFLVAQNDSIFLISGKIKTGNILGTLNQNNPFFILKRLNKRKETQIKSTKIYKVVSSSGATYIINNHYYLEKNKTIEEYRKNLERVRFFTHFKYNGYPITQVRFFKIMKKVEDIELNKYCRNYKILDRTAVPTIIIGGAVFGISYIVFANNNEARKHPYPYHEYSESTFYESIGAMASGALIGFTGFMLERYKHKKLKQKIIQRYNSLLLTP